MNLFGKFLPPVQLRFNSASKFATGTSPRSGIRKFGPYDASLFAKGEVNCGIICPANLMPQRDAFVNGMTNGESSAFPGFYTLFRSRLKFDPTAERRLQGGEGQLKLAVNDLAARDCDIVFVIVNQRNDAAYRAGKSMLLSNGIPCQYVTAGNLSDPGQRPWILANIALATYAKVGGTPWVVADTLGGRELVMGVSRAQDDAKNYVVGFVTLFNQDGDFLLLHSKTPVVSWNEYVRGLEELIVDAYREYEASFGVPESLVLHFHKRPGYQELEAIDRALKQLHRDIPYAMVHLNEFSPFRLFDTAHTTHVPQTGLQVDLSVRRALLLLDGREGDRRNRMGIPNVWDISLDKRSTMSAEEFPRLVHQVHRFAKVNWRGFNARSLPVTINYSKLICDQVLEIGLKSWNSVVSHGKLREKAWFL